MVRLGFDPPRYHNEPLELDSELGFRGIPGHQRRKTDGEGALFRFALNAQGFRGNEIPPAGTKDGDTTRIAFLGDSFLVGEGVPEPALLTSRVGEALQSRGIPNEVYNLSAADYGTGQQLLLLRRVGEQLDPDLVVLAVFPGNDLVNNFEGLAGRTAVSPGDYVRPYVVPEEGRLEIRYVHPMRAQLRRHSLLYALLERRALSTAALRGVGWLHPWPDPVPPVDRLAAGQAPYESLEIFRSHLPGDRWEQAWQRSFRLLAAFRDACAALSARLIVLVIPDLHQVQRAARDIRLDLLTRATQATPLDRWLDWNLPERRLAAFLREQEIESVLLLPALRSAAREGVDVYLRDRHLNARGHAIAAGAVAAVIAGDSRADTLLPDDAPVRLPRGRTAPRIIELGNAAHRRYLDENWIPWAATHDTQVEGALPLQGALVAVPAGGKELVVRGLAIARHYPLDLEISFVSGPRQSFQIKKPGPFALHIAVSGKLPRSDGYIGLRFGTDREVPDGGISTGLVVREVGFAQHP